LGGGVLENKESEKGCEKLEKELENDKCLFKNPGNWKEKTAVSWFCLEKKIRITLHRKWGGELQIDCLLSIFGLKLLAGKEKKRGRQRNRRNCVLEWGPNKD